MTTKLPPRITPEYVKDLFKRARANDEFLAQHADAWLAEHEGEWVGVDAEAYVFGDSLQRMIDDARAAGLDLRVLATAHLMRNAPAVLL